MYVHPNFQEIDLTATTKQGGAGLEEGPTYLVLYRGQFHIGKFTKLWYGLNFDGIYMSGAQYDPPGENYSSWQRIWVMNNADQISKEAEPEYKESKRNYAIGRMFSNGQRIDQSAPLDAFAYNPTVPAMLPKRVEEDEDED